MSEDQKRDPEGERGPDLSGLFSERPGGASGRKDADAPSKKDSPESTSAPTPPPPLDEEAVAKHRAAKQARIRKRREEVRARQAAAQGAAQGATSQDEARREPSGPPAKQPQKRKPSSALPALRPDIKPDTPALRAERVEAIRRDLVRRRRRKGGSMLLKLAACVIFPTLVVAWFLWFEASDMYRSEASFQVRGSEAGGGGGGLLGAFLGGGGGSNMFDPVAVQTYITSRDLLTKLDADHAWIAHFQDPEIDFWHSLEPDATFEDAFSHFTDMVTVSYDPTEGLIEMQLIATDAQSARRFSQAIIGYAEEMVDRLSDRIRDDALSDAEAYLSEAEAELRAAQAALAASQEQNEIFAIEPEVSQKYALIGALEAELSALEAKLKNLRRVTTEADPRVQRLRSQVETKREQIDTARRSIAGGDADQETLAKLNADMMSARLNVETATLKFTSALEQREVARSNAARQHRYLAVVSQPSLPDLANYPKKPEMTALAFLGFLGIYIVTSLTMSLIKEQASI